ncbi:MAG: class I SAM-dependent methyltransferase [Lactobacillaceae bacterium]|jgi:ubiquinone/menaquinone biosynthesis C-methylase UbiE|nr:class I SAM-dependent methyltransferase [Lactobacillaceae bacterium]
MTDNTKKFLGKADAYDKGRPNYSQDALFYMEKCGVNKNAVTADIGSGTGILSKQLLDLEAEVYAVEPNEEMRAKAEKNLAGYAKFHSVSGSAENTLLNNHSIDFVTVAQAFHWFDPELFKNECRRILKPNGKIFLLWNNGIKAGDMRDECYDLYEKYNPRDKKNSKNKDTEEAVQKFFKNFEAKKFDNEITYNKETFVAYHLSISATLTPKDKEFKTFVSELEDIFDKYQKRGIIRTSCDTALYVGTI